MELSKDQKRVLGDLKTWWGGTNRAKFITLGGYAGTGKTTLIGYLRKELGRKNKNLKVAFCSFTGKATRVLKNKLGEAEAMGRNDTISTIHGLIYSPIENDKKEIVGWERREGVEADLIIVDEASMVDEGIWTDLKSYGIPILAVGDHGQLPPINGNFNLMKDPILKLEEIHRQARENPIIKLSIVARERGVIPAIDFGKGVRKIKRELSDSQEIIQDELKKYTTDKLILCGYNNTRVKLNKFIREALGFESQKPEKGDRVICLRNNHTADIFNGMLGTIAKIKSKNENWYDTEIEMDDERSPYQGLIATEQFNNLTGLNFTNQRWKIMEGDLFDFGYALTVHKAQGSQAKKVVLFEERFGRDNEEMWRRWLYTAVTRAEKELLIIG
ncbi:MAG: AAA family ATPase [Candidatus Shapirobacteria bacterium]